MLNSSCVNKENVYFCSKAAETGLCVSCTSGALQQWWKKYFLLWLKCTQFILFKQNFNLQLELEVSTFKWALKVKVFHRYVVNRVQYFYEECGFVFEV